MDPSTPLPRVTIQFCTQCKWMLRAAYFAQELLSTFSTSLGEVALQPSTGGTFIVKLYNAAPSSSGDGVVSVQEHLLWDRKAEGGFPETKELKRRLRDIIDPSRNLGHVDGKKATTTSSIPPSTQTPTSTTTNTQQYISSPPIPRALNRLQAESSSTPTAERKFTPMDVDVSSRPGSSKGVGVEGTGESGGEEREWVNSRGKIVVGGGNDPEGGFCRPGEDCEDCG